MNRQAVSRRRIPPVSRALPGLDIRLVAVDLDGTLLNDSKQISDQTVRALSCVVDRGIRVVIASARPPRSVRHIYSTLKLDTWQINYNGALIWDEPKKHVVFHRPMQCQLVRRIINTARSRFASVLVSCEILDRWYTDRFDQSYTTETGRMFKPDVIAGFDEFCTQPITKLLLLGDRNMIDQLESMLVAANDGNVTIVRTDPQLLQIMDKYVSKATALSGSAGKRNGHRRRPQRCRHRQNRRRRRRNGQRQRGRQKRRGLGCPVKQRSRRPCRPRQIRIMRLNGSAERRDWTLSYTFVHF